MSTVYVVQVPHHMVDGELKPRYDLSKAERFGELKELLSPTAKPFDNNSDVVAELRKGLDNFSSYDYLLLIGNPALIGMATAIASEINYGSVRMLQWSNKDYVVIDTHLHAGRPEWRNTWAAS